MSQVEFFRDITQHLGGNVFGPFAALFLFIAALTLAGLFVFSVMQARREKADAELLEFLVVRHRIRDFEREALLHAARAARLKPSFLVLADPASFERISSRLRAALLSRLTVEPQVNEIVESLRERLFHV